MFEPRSYHPRASALTVLVLLAIWLLVPATASATALPKTISSNTTLTATGSPYTGSSVNVKKGVTLTAESGVVIKLDNGLEVNGALKVNGTTANPVVFTSKSDDVHGGDTNKDGSTTQPFPSEWSGLDLNTTSEGYMHHSMVLYGGSTYNGAASVRVHCPCAKSFEISDSVIAHSGGGGLSTERGTISLIRDSFEHNGEAGISVRSGSPKISENTISHNARGIEFTVAPSTHASVYIVGNTVVDNASYGIAVSAPTATEFIDSASLGENIVKGNGEKAITYDAYANYLEQSSYATSPVPANITTNVVSENARNAVWVSGTIVANQTWAPTGYSLIVGNGSVSVSKSATLTIASGTVIKAEGSLSATGSIHSYGTALAPVIFTTITNDGVGGDSNGDGSETSPSPGEAGGFLLEHSPETIIEHTDFSYGGHNNYPFPAMVEVRDEGLHPPKFIDSSFSHSVTDAIHLLNTDAQLIRDSIQYNVEAGVSVVSGKPKIQDCVISANARGIEFFVDPEFHARIDINKNTVENNKTFGISVQAHTAGQFVDSATMGENVVRGNGDKAIIYDTYGNYQEIASYATDPVPTNITSNIVEENGADGIWLGGSVTTNQSWAATDYSIVLTGSLVIEEAATLSIEAGAIVKAEGDVVVRGKLNPEGTMLKPVVFTSAKNDLVNGDTNGDGATSQPAPGDWGGFLYPDTSSAYLSHLVISYAHSAFYVQYLDSLTVANSLFVHNTNAVDVLDTAVESQQLAGLPCFPPYLSFVKLVGDTFSPGLSTNFPIGEFLPETFIPAEYRSLFSPFIDVANEVAPNVGSEENLIPMTIYSCEPIGVVWAPISPVIVG